MYSYSKILALITKTGYKKNVPLEKKYIPNIRRKFLPINMQFSINI